MLSVTLKNMQVEFCSRGSVAVAIAKMKGQTKEAQAAITVHEKLAALLREEQDKVWGSVFVIPSDLVGFV